MNASKPRLSCSLMDSPLDTHVCTHASAPGQNYLNPCGCTLEEMHKKPTILALRDPEPWAFLAAGWDFTGLWHSQLLLWALRCSHPHLLVSQTTSPTCQLVQLDAIIYLHSFQTLAPQTHWPVLGFTYSCLFSYTHAHGPSSLWF